MLASITSGSSASGDDRYGKEKAADFERDENEEPADFDTDEPEVAEPCTPAQCSDVEPHEYTAADPHWEKTARSASGDRSRGSARGNRRRTHR